VAVEASGAPATKRAHHPVGTSEPSSHLDKTARPSHIREVVDLYDDGIGDDGGDGGSDDDGIERICGWVKLSLRCALSLQPLTDPAKGDTCTHLPMCNYHELRDFVGRSNAVAMSRSSGGQLRAKLCPIMGCEQRLQRTRDVVRDDALRMHLEKLPGQPDVVWLANGELRTTPPEARAPPPRMALGCGSGGGSQGSETPRRTRMPLTEPSGKQLPPEAMGPRDQGAEGSEQPQPEHWERQPEQQPLVQSRSRRASTQLWGAVIECG